MQQAVKFGLSIKTSLLQHAISYHQYPVYLFCIPFSACSLHTHNTSWSIILAKFPSMSLKKGIPSILSIMSHCSGLWISPAPRAVSLEPWLTVGGSRRQRGCLSGCLSVVGKLCLPLPAVACWACGSSAPSTPQLARLAEIFGWDLFTRCKVPATEQLTWYWRTHCLTTSKMALF